MANIKKLSSGSYQITVSCGRDSTGRQVRQYLTYTPTAKAPRAIEKEVRQAADNFERRVKDGKVIEGDKMTLRDFVPVWEKNWAEEHLTTSVREGYVDILNNRVLGTIGDMKLSKINAVMIDSVLKAEKDKGHKIKTIKRTFTCIDSVFRYAFRMGIIEENPCIRVELPSQHVQQMETATQAAIQCFNLQQAKAFLTALPLPYEMKVKGQTRKHPNGSTYKVPDYYRTYTMPLQFQAYFTLAIYSGFRRGEMIALTWQAVDFKHNTITIRQAMARTKAGQVIKSPKTDSGYRTIELPAEVFDILRRLRAEQRVTMMKMSTAWHAYRAEDFDRNYIFTQDDGEQMDASAPRKRFKEFIAAYNDRIDRDIAAGIRDKSAEADKLPDIRLHDLRHTAASLLIASGCDPVTVAHRMGHKDVSVTLNTYSHAFKNEDSAASDTLQQLLG